MNGLLVPERHHRIDTRGADGGHQAGGGRHGGDERRASLFLGPCVLLRLADKIAAAAMPPVTFANVRNMSGITSAPSKMPTASAGTFAARRIGTITTMLPPGMPGTVNVVSTVTTTMTARWSGAISTLKSRAANNTATVWPTADPTRNIEAASGTTNAVT